MERVKWIEGVDKCVVIEYTISRIFKFEMYVFFDEAEI